MADATIYDVAQEAGVSISTVSLALNNPGRVRDSTLRRILDAVDRLGFVPKHEAVARARSDIGRVGVIAPFSSFASFAARLNGVLRLAARDGVEVVVFDEPSGARSRLATLPLTRRVDGLIVMSLPLDEDVIGRLEDQQIPTVLIELGRPGYSSVTIDDAAGGRLAGEHLVRKGHERIAYLGHAQNHEYESQSRLRLKGLREALPSPPQVRLVEHSAGAASVAAGALLSGPDRPTAIFAYSDVLASGVLLAARQLSLKVPQDVAVVGFDDTDVAPILGLTTIRQPLEESGEAAFETLSAQLGSPRRSPRTTVLELTLIERDTT